MSLISDLVYLNCILELLNTFKHHLHIQGIISKPCFLKVHVCIMAFPSIAMKCSALIKVFLLGQRCMVI